MSFLHANSVSTISDLVCDRIKEKATAEELKSAYIEESKIFSQPIMRESLYKLYTKKLVLQSEYETLNAR
jgi:hypothetical protein